MRLEMKEIKKITAVVSKRYRTADRKGKTKILDEFTATTGYNRKYAVRVLKNAGRTVCGTVDGKPVKYKVKKPCKAQKTPKAAEVRKSTGTMLSPPCAAFGNFSITSAVNF
jgi:hypothetical protein